MLSGALLDGASGGKEMRCKSAATAITVTVSPLTEVGMLTALRHA